MPFQFMNINRFAKMKLHFQCRSASNTHKKPINGNTSKKRIGNAWCSWLTVAECIYKTIKLPDCSTVTIQLNSTCKQWIYHFHATEKIEFEVAQHKNIWNVNIPLSDIQVICIVFKRVSSYLVTLHSSQVITNLLL